jgi:glycosyltransferase involved in cell wall biosynthesis
MFKKSVLYTAFDIVPSPKGASNHILHFLSALVNANYAVTLITPGDGILPAQDNLDGVKVIRIPARREERFLSRAVAFNEAVKTHIFQNPIYDIVHFRSIWGGLALVMARSEMKFRTIFEVNGLSSIELKYHFPGIEETNLLDKIREQEAASLLMSDAVICPSQVTRAFLISLGVPSKKITVIPNGADPEHFIQTPLPDIDSHQPVLLYIGTLAEWQGLGILIKALPFILKERQVRLQIIGRGRGRQQKLLEKQIQKMGLQEFVSVQEAIPHHQVPTIIQRADICVAPLGYNDRNVVQGCCPIKLIEYMACGRPVVVSNLPVAREIVRDGVEAVLFSPDDPRDLAEKILSLLGDRNWAAKIAVNAALRARSDFTWHAAQKRLIKTYRLLG